MSGQMKRIILGALLVLAGGFFLLQQLLNFPVGTLFIALLFVVGGGVFLFVLFSDRRKWWAAFPGFALVGIGVLIGSDKLFPAFANRFGGSIFLAFLALSFLTVLLLHLTHWWPVIPAGVLLTLAVVAGLRDVGALPGALFLMGTGATFAAIRFHPAGKNEKWVWIPAGILIGLGVFVLMVSGALINSITGWVFALAFLALGIYLVVRSAITKE